MVKFFSAKERDVSTVAMFPALKQPICYIMEVRDGSLTALQATTKSASQPRAAL